MSRNWPAKGKLNEPAKTGLDGHTMVRPATASFTKKPSSRTNLSSCKISVATTDWPAGDFSDLLCAMTTTRFSPIAHPAGFGPRVAFANGLVKLSGRLVAGRRRKLWELPLLFLGVSALYTGGIFLNDAFDADFDRQRRAERPIPFGARFRCPPSGAGGWRGSAWARCV